MSTGIVGVVLWGTVIALVFFLLFLGNEVRVARREGPREHLREPVLKGWDETGAPSGPASGPTSGEGDEEAPR